MSTEPWRRAQAPSPGGAQPSLISPTKPNPLRCSVLIRRCSSPLSPMALRAALMGVVRAASETIRPCQTVEIKSCLRRAPDCGSSTREDQKPAARWRRHRHLDAARACRCRGRNPRIDTAIWVSISWTWALGMEPSLAQAAMQRIRDWIILLPGALLKLRWGSTE